VNPDHHFESHAHDCRCAEIDVTTAFLGVSDELVAKALVVSEVAQIARAEMRARTLLLNHWRVRADQAAKMAEKAVVGGANVQQTLAVVDGVMGKFAEDVKKGFTHEIGTVYRLARVAGWKKGSGQTTASLSYQVASFTQNIADGKEKVRKAKADPKAKVPLVFDLVDDHAVADLQTDQMIWIGRAYNQKLREGLRVLVKPAITEGIGRTAAGKKIREAVGTSLRGISIPGGFRGNDATYFEGLAANTMTNARVRGQIRSFDDLELTTYQIMNPDDERTSLICRHMVGKQFQTSQAVAHIEKLSGAKNPAFVKQHHPWLSYRQLVDISSKVGHVSTKDSNALAKAGLPLPPYHFRCRSTVDAV
jgi:hypothetical protein